LALARNEECGLRCLYHGWKIDVDGNVTDMPSEPPESGFARRVKHKTWPTREGGGFIWIYMGPGADMPEWETPSWAVAPDNQVSIVRMEVACNWAQVMEGQIDSAHSSVLHSTDMRPARVTTAGATDTHWTRPSTDKNPRIQVQRTSYGMRYAAIRRPIQHGDTHDYVRITTYVAPFIAHIPPNSSYNVATVIVPKDDTSTWFHFLIWGDPATTMDQAGWRKFCCATVGEDLDRDYKLNLRRADNNYLQDRKAMRNGNFTGISGIPTQDIAMWESMGPISDRTSERLGASDIAVVEFRRLMIEAAQCFAAGEGAIGLLDPRLPQAKLCSWQGIVPKNEDWRLLGASEEEQAWMKGCATQPRLSAAAPRA
jgi:phthalate 4,5-dioxygenase oxygenase subunit